MNIQRAVSINGRLRAIEEQLSHQMVILQGFDLYLRSVEKLLLDKNLVTKEELDTNRKAVLDEYLNARKFKSQIIAPE